MSRIAIDNDSPLARKTAVLRAGEIRWRDYHDFLKARGYQLRRRYRPGWTPSWLSEADLEWSDADDGVRNLAWPDSIIDAIRIVDKRQVILKLVNTTEQEYTLTVSLRSGEQNKDARNHCVPVLDTLALPDTDEELIMVTPLLRPFYSPKFETVGEALACITSLLEGLVYLHERNIAHLDISEVNVMMDPGDRMFPSGFHPVEQSRYWINGLDSPRLGWCSWTSRTVASVRYYYIDFGVSIQYPAEESNPVGHGVVGHNTSLPEFRTGDDSWDPFKVDIRCFGDMIKEFVLDEYYGLEFLGPLIDSMRSDIPEDRPSSSDALKQLDTIIKRQTHSELWKLLKPTPGKFVPRSYWEYRTHVFQAKMLHRSPLHIRTRRSLWEYTLGRVFLSSQWIQVGKFLQRRLGTPKSWDMSVNNGVTRTANNR